MYILKFALKDSSDFAKNMIREREKKWKENKESSIFRSCLAILGTGCGSADIQEKHGKEVSKYFNEWS